MPPFFRTGQTLGQAHIIYLVMRAVIEDARYALRLLRNSPIFTVVVILTVSLGVGANTAIYTLLEQVLLRSLPVKDPNQLVMLRYSGNPGTGTSRTRTDHDLYFSYPMYRDLRDNNSVLSGLIATTWAQVGIEFNSQPELADAELVSGNYFDTLGVQPVLGRLFVPSDDAVEDANPIVVLSFNYWQRRFALKRDVLNQTVDINGHPFTIVGVAAAGFHSVVAGDNPAIFVPMMMKPEITPGWNDLNERRSSWLNIIGRLNPGLTRQQAQSGLAPLWYSIRADELKAMTVAHPHIYSDSQADRDAFLTNSHLFLHDGSKGIPIHNNLPPTLIVIMALSGLLALMICANVAGLLLLRVATRAREISVRYSLGAQRARVIQQLLMEGLLLGVVGGVIGIVIASPIAALLIRIVWIGDTKHFAFTANPDLRVFAFNFGLTLLVGVLFSVAPASQIWRTDLMSALKQQGTVIVGGSQKPRRLSVIAQIGLSLLLLLGAGLFVRTLHNLRAVNVGFVTDHLITFTIDPSLAGYEVEQTLPLCRTVLARVSTLPGVASVAATSDPELAGNSSGSDIKIVGYQPAEQEDMNVEWEEVTAGYFSTLRMPMLAGREITDQDHSGTQKVAVVNQSFARRFFGSPQGALGRYFRGGAGDQTPIEIVGVVEDAKHTGIRDATAKTVFTPYLQEERPGVLGSGVTFYVRIWQEPNSAESTIRQALHELDSKLVLDDFRTMREQVDEELINERAIAFLATSFGILAALIAALGIYGMLAYSTTQRTREIGIRIAIGAARSEIIRMVLSEVARLLAIGTAIGLTLGILFARLLSAQLFGISNYDPLTLCAVCAVILVVGFISAGVPAIRAAKIDPTLALRHE
jgi:putative ABC transport system permease protein